MGEEKKNGVKYQIMNIEQMNIDRSRSKCERDVKQRKNRNKYKNIVEGTK